MTRQLISSSSTFEQEIGYSRAVFDGDWVFLSGTTASTPQPCRLGQSSRGNRTVSGEHCVRTAGSRLEPKMCRHYVCPTGGLPNAAGLRKYFGAVRRRP